MDLKKYYILLALLLPLFLFSESKQKWYADQMYNGFLLQSIGETRLAYRVFKTGYDGALKAGESLSKLKVANELFLWYRKYGWDSGVMAKPCNCLGEQRSYKVITYDSSIPHQDPQFESEWGKNPDQARHIRMFMFGISQVLSGIFVIGIGKFIPITFGWGLIGAGVATMVSSLNAEWTEEEKRVLELKQIEWKAKEACP